MRPGKMIGRAIGFLPILVFMFLFVFMPMVILPFNILHILAMTALSISLTMYRRDFLVILKSRAIIIFIGLHLCIIIYTLILSYLTSFDFTPSYYAVATILEVLPCAIYISIVLIRKKISIYGFYDVILMVGIAQVLWILACILSPGLRDWIISSSRNQGLEEVYDLISEFRLFGLARSYTFAMPLFLGLCVLICLVLAKYKSSKYYVLIPVFLLAIMVNARIGLASLLTTLIVLFIFRFKKYFVQETIAIVVLAVIILYGFSQIESFGEGGSGYSVWANWVSTGIRDFLNYLLFGEEVRNMAVTSDMWFVPEGLGLIFGTGENVFGRGGRASDLGYIVNLYYGGVIFSAGLYGSYVFFMSRLKVSSVERVMFVSMMMFLLVVNIKGNVFRPNEVINASILLVVFSVAHRKLTSTQKSYKNEKLLTA